LGPPLLTVRETAARLRVSTATVYKAIRAGVLPAVRIVGQFRIGAADVALLVSGRLPVAPRGLTEDAERGGP